MKKLSITAAILPTLASAHVGDHSHVGPDHLLTQPDHLGVIGVVVVVALGAWLWIRSRS
ncbi:hypothetical protein PAF17_03460 [Paracoccus sp. Z330]|uniref:Peptidase M23 n=1 Tax=Paracoccus onchidii TaxID=3017813 RepID=A0ABT4ZC84_9RHOB|nr:hypothetical protein [Paracoccus onchidii]MDB6176558.1 hypothetical protein [Paracoccus onchidii]